MKRRYHLHMPGVIYLALVMLIALAAINSQNNLLFWLFGVLFTGLLISGVVSGVIMLGIRVRRLEPRPEAVGRPMLVRYAVTNRWRLFPVFNVHIEERTEGRVADWGRYLRGDDAWIMHIGPRETVHGDVIFKTLRRGEVHFDRLRIWTTFPFGLVRKSITFSQPQSTCIYPRLHEIRSRVIDAMAPHINVGTRVANHAGAGEDYFGLREYRPGDSMRHIAWKRTARFDELVTIERSLPAPPRARIILNLTQGTESLASRHPRFEAARELEEQAISLAASFVAAGDRAGHEVGLTVLGLDHRPIPVRGMRRHYQRMMTVLAAIDLDSVRRSVRLPAVPDAERAAMIVIHPDRVQLDIGAPTAWHVSATQLEHLAIQSASGDAGQEPGSAIGQPVGEAAA